MAIALMELHPKPPESGLGVNSSIAAITTVSARAILCKEINIQLSLFWLQEIILAHTFSEILSTRRYHSDSGGNFLDMKIGNLMVQKILRIETDQVSWSHQSSSFQVVLKCFSNVITAENSDLIDQVIVWWLILFDSQKHACKNLNLLFMRKIPLKNCSYVLKN